MGMQRASSSDSLSLKDLMEADVFSDPGAKRRRISLPDSNCDDPHTQKQERPERPPAVRRKSSKFGKENADALGEMPPPPAPRQSQSVEPQTVEEQNKALVKKHILSLLTNAGCSRAHPEFRDCFSTINRGVVFALRRHMRKRRVERDEVVRLVGMHVGMYFIPESPVKQPRSKARGPLEKADEDVVWA